MGDWRENVKPEFVTDAELRQGISLVFTDDEPTIDNTFEKASYIFQVRDGDKERKLRAGRRLAHKLGSLAKSLRGRTIRIKREGEGFKTTHQVELVQ